MNLHKLGAFATLLAGLAVPGVAHANTEVTNYSLTSIGFFEGEEGGYAIVYAETDVATTCTRSTRKKEILIRGLNRTLTQAVVALAMKVLENPGWQFRVRLAADPMDSERDVCVPNSGTDLPVVSWARLAK